MAEIVYMPKLSDTMTEGVVAEWTVKVGDEVASGEILAEIETDKATMEFESFYDGVLLYIGVEKGATAPINSILAIIGDKDEDVDMLLAEAEKATLSPKKEEEVPSLVKEVVQPAAVAAPVSAPVPAAVTPLVVADTNGRVFASPLAKKMANEKGINLNNVGGTGQNGRIVKRDIDNFTLAAAAQTSVATGVENYTEEPVSQMRKVIASRLSESKFTAPHFYLTMDIDMDNSMAARKQINAAGDVKISFNDFANFIIMSSVTF